MNIIKTNKQKILKPLYHIEHTSNSIEAITNNCEVSTRYSQWFCSNYKEKNPIRSAKNIQSIMHKVTHFLNIIKVELPLPLT